MARLQDTGDGTGRRNEGNGGISTADLSAALNVNGVGGWFLFSLGELTAMDNSLRAAGAADVRDRGMADNCQYWTSPQQTPDMANHAAGSPTTSAVPEAVGDERARRRA